MTEVGEQPFTIIYAMYDETPIACQGDDDQRKIRVITDSITGRIDVHAEALKRSVALSKAHRTHVQVWDVQPGQKK